LRRRRKKSTLSNWLPPLFGFTSMQFQKADQCTEPLI
jgi:hypothetical protein